jgi:hypothetical protein
LKKSLLNNLGPAVGSFLYSLGGFTLPFFSFGLLNILLSVGLILLMPNVKKETQKIEEKNDKKLTFSAMVEVNIDKLKMMISFMIN